MQASQQKPQESHYSIFDIAGPIMVGPSSSHTGGACKLGQIARALFHGTPDKVTFVLHGSFATVYKGHATDRALLAGVMRFKTSDPRIKDAFEIAKKNRLQYIFKTADLGRSQHPNTVKIIVEKKGRKSMSMIGSSIGGGMVQVVRIDQFDVSLHGIAGHYKTLIVWHDRGKTILDPLKKELKKHKIRIHDIQTTNVGHHALSIINMEGKRLNLKEVLALETFDGIEDVRSLTSLEKQ
ncbi:L-serine ammonia-lyase, iron-sulfur-dependent subunit beta [Patescibacteria group bacterium]|nr:L-serine ammonia-lyase, iron-sulfur-dependent subunit beta [Patescibacteria group bacterium]MBU1703242.1 L-serine ammonia-lyase, iron-sulfur-dependent subunit beta [Patescibacteria group bacterium]MBU1953657.1 L-serine ammonia-lyase, iron-sulfur-dependent subunit beta [Patescibacteria group bacterium]